MKLKIAFACMFLFAATTHATPVGLMQALKEAETNSPKLKSSSLQVAASRNEIEAARAGYLPSLDVNAIASDGSPGAFGFLGVDNNISANDRIGTGAAAVLHQTIWDFGRTSGALRAAKSESELQEKKSLLDQADVDTETLQTYFHCAFLNSEIADAEFTANQAQIIAKETSKYVRSGQRSVIEKYLVDAQAKEAETLAAELKEREEITRQRLALLMGRATQVTCPNLDVGEQEVKALEKNVGQNPLFDVAQAQSQVAKFKLDQAKAERMPNLLGVATGGYFNDIRNVDGWNYSAGIGVTFPLFDGFYRASEVDRRKAELASSEALTDFSKQIIEESNSKYMEQVKSLKVRLDYLDAEITLARAAFNLAKSRYFGFKGTMVDLRESLRNISRVTLSIDQATRDLLVARGSYAIYNGASSKNH